MIVRRVLRSLAAAAFAVTTFGCANIWGANPADGACGYRPSGLVESDLVGTWALGSTPVLTLNADGTFVHLDAPRTPDAPQTGTPGVPSGSARASAGPAGTRRVRCPGRT